MEKVDVEDILELTEEEADISMNEENIDETSFNFSASYRN